MLTRKHTMSVPKCQMEARFAPNSLNDEARTVELVWSTGARVKRGGWFSEPFMEELSMDPGNIRLDRLNSGANLLDSHASFGLRNVLGVVERAWVDNGKGHAVVRFSARPEVESIWQDVRNGIIRQISVGYKVHKFEEQKERVDDLKVFRAVDWEPMEVSFVAVPADAGAKVRSDSEELSDCVFELRGEDTMTVRTDGAPVASVAQEPAKIVDENAIRQEATATERKRVSEITDLVKRSKLDDSVAKELVDGGKSVDEARAAILDKLVAKEPEVRSGHVAITRDENETRVRGAEEALLHRADPRANKLTELGREYRGMTMLDMARDFCAANHINTRGMDKMEIARRAFHSTSDFPLLLANVAGKSLRSAYDAAPKGFEPIVRTVYLPDFKPVSRVSLGDAPNLDPLLESGEITYGTFGEAAEPVQLRTFAKAVSVTRQAIINDDMDGFTRIPMMFGRRAAELEAGLVFGIFNANPLMADGQQLFSVPHGNLGAGGAINIALVGAARAAMRLQTGINGAAINVSPRYLVAPVALETAAQQFLSVNIFPVTDATANPFKGSLGLITHPVLDAAPAIWYLVADPASIDTIEIAYLQGEPGPVIESENGFDVEGVKIKCRLDVGVKAIDWRGVFRG
jgi:hypothetical protein